MPNSLDSVSGELAVFDRVKLGQNAEQLPMVGSNVKWTTNGRGILRFVPEFNQMDVITTISSASYADSTIYPWTVKDRLFVIQDWDISWPQKNKRFNLKEVDPNSRPPLSSTGVEAEWFTILGDHAFYLKGIKEVLYGNPNCLRQVIVACLGTKERRKLVSQDSTLHGVGG